MNSAALADLTELPLREETALPRCGRTITVSGQIQHYRAAENLKVFGGEDTTVFAEEAYAEDTTVFAEEVYGSEPLANPSRFPHELALHRLLIDQSASKPSLHRDRQGCRATLAER